MSRIETIRARLAEAGDGLYESDLAWAVRALDALVDAIESYVSATHYDTSPISRTAAGAHAEDERALRKVVEDTTGRTL